MATSTRATQKKFEPWTDPDAKPYVRIEKVTKKFGDFIAVDDVTLDIYKKEIFCLLGASGCGKTTLLRMLAGFEKPTSGKIFIDGVDMTTIPPYERPVNMMFQSYAVFPHMTVEQNVAFGLKQEGLAKAEIAKRVGDMLELVRLGQFAKRKPHQLSGGQRQRVALARALVKKPKLLLLDEPLAALDKKLREHTQFELRFVAEFIGSVNTFEGKLIEDEPSYVRIESADLEAPIFVDHGVSSAPGATIWAAIRPEKMLLSREKPEGADNWASGIVQDIAYMGDMSIYLIRLDSGKVVRVTQPNTYRHADDRITWEERVYLTWHPESPVVVTK